MTPSPHARALEADRSVLLLVDHQARLMPVIADGARVLARARRLVRAAQRLGLPIVGTEQNPTRLGPNDPALRAACHITLAKTHFDACADGLLPALESLPPRLGAAAEAELVIAGCEAHVCLLQTALGLRRAGRRVWVVQDACGSRRPADHALAMQRLAAAGCMLVSHEMVVFEWAGDCEAEAFRDLLALVKPLDDAG